MRVTGLLCGALLCSGCQLVFPDSHAPAPGGDGGLDLLTDATRARRSDSFGPPEKIPELSLKSTLPSALTSDGLVLLLTSHREGEIWNTGLDLYLAQRTDTDSPWEWTERLAELASPLMESGGWIDDSLTLIYFTSSRDEGPGASNIWISPRGRRRPGGVFTGNGRMVRLSLSACDRGWTRAARRRGGREDYRVRSNTGLGHPSLTTPVARRGRLIAGRPTATAPARIACWRGALPAHAAASALLFLGVALAACGSRQTVPQGGDGATTDDAAAMARDGGDGADALAPPAGDGSAGVADVTVVDAHPGGDAGEDDAGARRDGFWWPFDLGVGDRGPVADGSADGAALADSGGGDSGGVAPGQSCATAQPLLLVGGKVSVAGDTSGAINEFGTAIDCGSYASSASPTKFVTAGGQHYYQVAVKPGQSYKVTLSPQYWGALLYAFSGCDPVQINTDCGSGGETGDVAPNLTKNVGPRILVLTATTSSLLLAVDGVSPSAQGPYVLTVEQFTPATNATCAAAQPLILAGGKVTTSGDLCGVTGELAGQISCGVQTLDGPQLYYRVNLEAGAVYALRVRSPAPADSFWPLMLAIFGDHCDPLKIDADCGSGGKSGAATAGYFAPPELVGYFAPPETGAYRLMVRQPVNIMPEPPPCLSFELTVEAITPPANSTCATAKALPVIAGAASSTDPIGGSFDEPGTQVSCGMSSPLVLPQLYYRVDLDADQPYRIEAQLMPAAPATPMVMPVGVAVALFGDGCDPSQIEADCASDGVSGALWLPGQAPLPNGITRGFFTPSVSGAYRIAAELWVGGYPATTVPAAAMPSVDGSIKIAVEAFTPAPNGTCATAETVALQSDSGLIEADTSGVGNEFGTLINCGESTPMAGPQLYYRLSLVGGKQYDFAIDSSSAGFPVQLYVVGQTCDPAQINTACGSGGASGAVGRYGELSFTPAASGDHILVIDSSEPGNFGAVKVTITAS